MYLYHVMACMFAGHLKGNSRINVLDTSRFSSMFSVFCIYSIHIVTFCSFLWVWNCCHSLNVATRPTKFVTSLFYLFKYQITRISIKNNYYVSGSCSIDALSLQTQLDLVCLRVVPHRVPQIPFSVKRKKHSTDKYTHEVCNWKRIKQGGKCTCIIKIL